MHPPRSILWLPLLALCAGCATSAPPVSHRVANDQRSSMLERLGDDMRRNGDAAGAIELYRVASMSDPRNVGALQRMGDAFLAIHDAPRAEQAFRGALASDPENRAARHGLALSTLAQGRAAEALPILQQLAAQSPDPRLLRAEGVALDMLGRPREAQVVYRQGLQLDPIDAGLHGNLALSLALRGDAAAALAQMQAAVNSPVPDPRQNANAVLVLALTGDVAAARTRGDATIGPAATEILLARAQQAAVAGDARQRAVAIGMLSGNGSGQTPVMPPVAATAPATVAVPAAPPASNPTPAPPQRTGLPSGSPTARR